MQCKVNHIEEEERRTHTQTHNMKIHQHIHKHLYGHTYTRPHTHPYTPRHKEEKKQKQKQTKIKKRGKACDATRKSGGKEVRIRKLEVGRADPRTGSHGEMLYLQSICEYMKKKKGREKRKIFNDEKEV